MPPHTKLKGPPFTYLAPGGVWPDGPLVDDAPAEALLAQAIAKRIHEARGDRSGRDIAREAKISPTTVSKYLKGKTWGDLPTLCRIELAVGTQLWGDEHLAVSRPRDYLADDAVWPTQPSRPRDYLADDAVWPTQPSRPRDYLADDAVWPTQPSRPRDYLADDAVWPTQPSRPRDYLADDAVWPTQPSRPRDYLADDAVWPTQPSRPRDYLADDAVWPIGPLRDSAPPEAHLILAIAQRVHRALDRPTISRTWISDQMTFHIVAFLDGKSWGNVRVIAHLHSTLASGLWG